MDYNNKEFKGYRLICDVYNTIPNKKINWEYCIKTTLPKLKKVMTNINLNNEELNILDDYYSCKIKKNYQVNHILNKIRKSEYLSLLKEDKATFTSFTSNGVPLYVDCLGASITDKECSLYIEEIYKIFGKERFINVNINSSKSDIKFFLKQVTNYVINNDVNHNKYNYHHLGFIHSYFIQKGWTNIYKTMEIFLRTFYFDADITYWYLDYNIRRKNKESIKYKIEFIDDNLFQYEDLYKKDLMYRLSLAKRYYKDKICLVLLSEKDFYNTYKIDEEEYMDIF